MSFIKAVDAISAITINTFRETVRDRILYAFVFFACIFTLVGIVLGSLSVGQDTRILEDLGLAVISVIGGIIAIFVGTNLVYKEIERRTIYLIVTKPIARWQFVLGKYAGLALCVFIVTLAMGTYLLGLVYFCSPDRVLNWNIFTALALIYLELLFVIALAIFFSTFATPIMSVIFTLALWLIGHVGQSLLDLSKMSASPAAAQICRVIYWTMPDLAKLTQVRADMMYGRFPDLELIYFLVAYILGYIIFLLMFSTIITERREFS